MLASRLLARILALGSMAAYLLACDADVLVGEFESVELTTSSGGTTATTSSITTGGAGAPPDGVCTPASCEGRIYQCGNCEDDDADGLIDSEDPDCLGPCHNAENTYFGSIPGQDEGGCQQDCYFDRGAGSGNDGCEWHHQCDPLSPNPDECPYDPNVSVGGPPKSCQQVLETPSSMCLDTCLPLVPNGCDCFGCCDIPGAPGPVLLGSRVNGVPSCDRASIADPERCKPCTQVEWCKNPCEECELCVGKTELPPGCQTGSEQPPQSCPVEAVACGLAGQDPCTVDHYCITGCCILTIR